MGMHVSGHSEPSLCPSALAPALLRTRGPIKGYDLHQHDPVPVSASQLGVRAQNGRPACHTCTAYECRQLLL